MPANSPGATLTEMIKAEARRLGFALVGVTSAAPPPHYAVFEDWLAAGRQAGMAYLATERSRRRRGDPHEILPGCRSMLVVGMRYSPPPPSQREEVPSTLGDRPIHGRIAAYAWGADYHDALLPRLEALAAFIEAAAGKKIDRRAYTDSGPILERDLAQRAGLGWIGKNTCLIHPRHGSYFLLAELLLDLELEADAPFEADRCGSCRRCIDACPTDCILPDRTLDAGRCISYLSIENKGSVPAELREEMGNWIFGCDICQTVCPWNLRFAGAAEAADFAPRPGVLDVELRAEMALTPEEFRHKFKGSPVLRAKRRGYLRNVAVALGNAGRPEAVPSLSEALLQDAEALVRAHAAWALGRLGGQAARQALSAAQTQESDPQVLAEIRAALAAAKAG